MLPQPTLQELNGPLAQTYEQLRLRREKLAIFWRTTIVSLLVLYSLGALNTDYVRATYPALAPLFWGLAILAMLLSPASCLAWLGILAWMVSWAQMNKAWCCPVCLHTLHPITWRKRSPLHCTHCGVRLA